ncbi:Glycopeptide antibiotics resistance protein [Streptococcus thermophilus]|uniref:Glycopeptide antibiotics resistance protein n=1 Tax=Streptococcus thermophilus TaxID=1308 RepID=A0A8D6UCG6_STRTR|nr:VanZ family protein [Streptococcus thermophilus]CAD0150816.1 Glycopeptide antibiotics resistance protein [Streptococcus thermophilus]
MEKVLSNILLRIISLGLSYWFYRGHLEQYVHYIAHYGPYFQVFLNLVIIILLEYFIYAFLKLLLTRKIKKQTLLLLYFIYFLSLFYLLFLKNIGIQGLSLSPLSFAQELYWGSHFVPIMNLLMFIPLGLLFSSQMSNLLLCLIALFSVESIQYFGHLGIFDLGDIVLNMLGLLVGTAIHQLPQFQTLIKKILT